MNTEFKSLVGYEEIEVNAEGVVRKVKINHGSDHYVGINKVSGQFRASFYNDGQRRSISMLKLVAGIFVENPNNYKWVNVKDDDINNYKADNLEWVRHNKIKYVS